MLAELTAEERVTKILSSYQVLKRQDDLSFENEGESLGEYLQKAPVESQKEIALDLIHIIQES